MNETFQDIKVLSGTSLLDGYLIPANKFDERPLIRRIFEQEDWKQEYLDYCCSLITEQFTLEHLGKFVLDRHRLVDETYREDPNRYNSYESFRGSLTDYNEDAVSLTHSGFVLRLNYPGIFPFIQSQREWAVKQMSGWDHACSIESNDVYDLPVFPNPSSDYVNIANGNTGFEYAQLRLYDFSGRLVRATEFTLTEGSHSTLGLEGISSGMYLLIRLSADGRTGRAKLVVSRQ